MQKITSPNPEPIHHLDGARAQVSARMSGEFRTGSGLLRRLRVQLLSVGALALLAGPFLTLTAQEPQNPQAPAATAQKATPEPKVPAPAKPGHTTASHRHTAQRSGHHSQKEAQKEAAAKPAQEAAVTPAAPPPPPLPDWPANHQPNPATVVWNSHGLAIQASNSSLGQILHDVATDTGAKLEGLGEGRDSDQRVFGNYGPGPAREVISKLLDGSGYNVVMIGGSADQPPQQIILSTSAAGTPPPPNTAAQPSEQLDDQNTPTEQNVEQDYSPPQYPMPPRNPFGGPPPRTPQEMQQQIQQRQQQLEQLRQQQQQRGFPQQTPQQPQ